MTSTKRWHSIDCPHIGMAYSPVSTCPGCAEMRAEGIQPLSRRPEILGYRASGYRFTKKAPLDDSVAVGVDRSRGWRGKWNDAEGTYAYGRRKDPEAEYERLMQERDRMGAD